MGWYDLSKPLPTPRQVQEARFQKLERRVKVLEKLVEALITIEEVGEKNDETI